MQLTFLGTGGGRFTMIDQLRRTGGMVLEHGEFSMLVDPGPGALVHARKQNVALEKLDALLVSHAHLDHYGDMKAIIEAMTDGTNTPRGTLLASSSVLHGAPVPDRYVQGEGTYGGEVEAVLDDYHANALDEVVELQDGSRVEIGPFHLDAVEVEHSDPRTIAFTLATDERTYGFVTDTELFDGLTDFFQDCDVLVLNVMRPVEKEWKGHLTVEDAARILNTVEPEFAVLQHFGSALIYASVNDQAEWLAEHTDVDFVMADDGMEIDLDRPENGLERFLE